ncbi:MAG TPA: type II toxin-antitoxin system VapC family toxin [Acidobacteriota bacterium]
MIVLDTHVWVWWINGSPEVSVRAKRTIDKARGERTIYLSSISIWEVALLVERNRLRLNMDVRDWIEKVETLPFLNFIPVDNKIALKSVYLPGPLHGDPADRIIIATALMHDAVLVTRDEKIISYPHVRTLW